MARPVRSWRFGKGSHSGPRTAATQTIQTSIGGGTVFGFMEGLTAVHHAVPFTDKNNTMWLLCCRFGTSNPNLPALHGNTTESRNKFTDRSHPLMTVNNDCLYGTFPAYCSAYICIYFLPHGAIIWLHFIYLFRLFFKHEGNKIKKMILDIYSIFLGNVPAHTQHLSHVSCFSGLLGCCRWLWVKKAQSNKYINNRSVILL